MSDSKQLNVLKQLFDNLSDTEKQAFIKSLNQPTAKSIIEPRKIQQCPYCGGSHFVKNGTRQGRQRFICRDCHKTFVAEVGSVFFGSQKRIDVWQKYVDCMMDKLPLRRCAEICDISLPTAFIWRHKILDALQKMQNQVQLDGVTEADETFFRLSFKGNHKKSSSFRMPRPAKHRGTPGKTGLPKDLVCVPTGINLDGKSIAKISNLGKPRHVDIAKVISGRIAKGSVFVTDSLRSYCKLSFDMELNHIRIPRKKHSVGVFNIQTINSYHSMLKALVLYRFRGVATKYLNNYLVYHNFVNFDKESNADKHAILLNFIRNNPYLAQSRDIPKRAAVPI